MRPSRRNRFLRQLRPHQSRRERLRPWWQVRQLPLRLPRTVSRQYAPRRPHQYQHRFFHDVFFNHRWTRMDTDSVVFIRVYPWLSVVNLFWLRLGRAASVSRRFVARRDDSRSADSLVRAFRRTEGDSRTRLSALLRLRLRCAVLYRAVPNPRDAWRFRRSADLEIRTCLPFTCEMSGLN